MKNEIVISASKVKRRKKIKKISKLVILIILFLLLMSYIVISLIYNRGSFSISLDKNLYLKHGVVIYDDPTYKVFRTDLYAETLDTFDNISYKWLPTDLHDLGGGSHNGDNYISYTFFVENLGDTTIDYWSEITLEDVIKNVDEAIRIRVYKNEEVVTYAKIGYDDKPEKETTPFKSKDIVELKQVKGFAPKDINRYTIVIWLEGNDPQCNDNILGGEVKIVMAFNSELIEK